MILSLQGCMAVGKTTAVRYLQEHAPYVHISYEINTDVIDEIKRRGLDKNKYEDYIEIQKLWLKKELHRWKKAKDYAFQELGLHRIEGNVMPRNKASIAVALKCGFEYEGVSKKYMKINGVWEDHAHYVKLNESMEE